MSLIKVNFCFTRVAVILIATPFFYFSQQKKTKTGNLMLELQHFAGKDLLKLDSGICVNDLGQSFTVTNFKYYLGNIGLTRSDGKTVTVKNYFLVREDETESKRITISVPEGDYTAISFTLGVDSIDNCSGAQNGALDPVNAMFWTWNTGYIFLKLEGKSTASALPGNIFEYHIGGYKMPSNCIRTIMLELKNKLNVSAGAENRLKLKVDVNEILKSPTAVDFSKLPSVTDKNNAATIADNYKDMFSIIADEK